MNDISSYGAFNQGREQKSYEQRSRIITEDSNNSTARAGSIEILRDDVAGKWSRKTLNWIFHAFLLELMLLLEFYAYSANWCTTIHYNYLSLSNSWYAQHSLHTLTISPWLHYIFPLGPPFPPTNLKVLRIVSNDSLILTWNMPPIDKSGCSNGALVTGYKVYNVVHYFIHLPIFFTNFLRTEL